MAPCHDRRRTTKPANLEGNFGVETVSQQPILTQFEIHLRFGTRVSADRPRSTGCRRTAPSATPADPSRFGATAGG